MVVGCQAQELPDQGAQKPRQPVQQELEVVSGSSKDGIGSIALPPGKVVASHPMTVFQMANGRLDRGAAGQFAFDLISDATFLPSVRGALCPRYPASVMTRVSEAPTS